MQSPLSTQKVIIMCGGRGRRMGKQSDQIPKPLSKLNNKTILENKIENCLKQGIKDFIICIGHKGELIKQTLKTYEKDCNIEYSNSGPEAGILKRIYDTKHLFEDFVHITYGDTLTNINLDQFSNFHLLNHFEASIAIAPIQNPFGLIEYDENKITFFKEKPILNYYIGQAVLSKSALDLIPEKVIDFPDGEGLVTFFKILLAMEKLGAWKYDGFQITFNTQKELSNAKQEWHHYYTSPETYEE